MNESLSEETRNPMQISGEIVIEECREKTAEERIRELETKDAPRLFVP